MLYFARRFISLIVTLVVVSMIVFVLFQIIPGDPALTILGMDADEAQLAALRAQLGTDQPLINRYADWGRGILKGDAGQSLRFSMPVTSLIKSRLPVTLLLSIMALVMAVAIAIPLGVIAARSHGKWSDYVISIVTQLGMAIPSFWMGIILILIFGVRLQWFRAGGYVPWSDSPIDSIKSLFLPAVAIAIPVIATIVRYLRTTVIEQLKLDYVRTAYSKGLSKKNIVYRHVLKNSLIPVITVMGMIIASVLGGSLVIEQVFALPGIGRLLVSSISYRDFYLVQGMVMYIAVAIIMINFLVDVIYKFLDPRIKLR